MGLVYDLWTLMVDGKLCLAPIEYPRHVLDVGTGTGIGTGIWTIEFADNPQAPISSK
jgi:hypothetical protein